MQYVAKMIDDVVRTTAPVFDQINKVVTESAKKIEELYNKQVRWFSNYFFKILLFGVGSPQIPK